MILDITPNIELFVWLVIIAWVVNAVCNILCGLLQVEKNHRTHYGYTEVIAGTLSLGVVIWVLVV